MDLFDLRSLMAHGKSVKLIADFLCRDIDAVLAKIEELGLKPEPPASDRC
jgi:hypothetical protein